MRVDGTPSSVPPPSSPLMRLVPGKTYDFLLERRSGSIGVVRFRNGLRLSAQLDGRFPEGVWSKAVATKSGNAIVLRHIRPGRTRTVNTSVPSRAGLPKDPTADALVAAFIRQGLPLRESSLQTAYRRLRAHGSHKLDERARLLAILEEKGLGESAAAWEDLQSVVVGDDARHDHERDESRKDGRHESEASGDDTDLPVALKELVQSSVSTAEHATSALQLFNHVMGPGDHWIIIPIGLPEEVATGASLRLLIPRHDARKPSARITYQHAILQIDVPAGAWAFRISATKTDEPLRVALIESPGGSGLEESPQALSDALSQVGAVLENMGAVATGFDGFSTEGEQVILKSTDVEA